MLARIRRSIHNVSILRRKLTALIGERMEEHTKEEMVRVGSFLLLLWILINTLGFIVGSAFTHQYYCDAPISRISVLFPGKAIGCWFSKPIWEDDE